MKKSLPLLLALVLAFFAGACKKEELKIIVPQNVPHYGYTKEGVFFVHDTLIQNAGFGPVSLRSLVSEYKPRPMEKKGDYWFYDARADATDMERFRIYKDFPISYYFELPDKAQVPGSLVKYPGLFDREFIRAIAGIGFVFYTEPVPSPAD
ncbi:MAG: hypothetical protein HZB23_10360 [Deltaproteobacteria bacterium]|nr:hypothetical protein [Deltaproteobacteria bacterium]